MTPIHPIAMLTTLLLALPAVAVAAPKKPEPTWAVVPASTKDEAERKRARRAAEALVKGLRRQRQRPVKLEAAAEAFREKHSREPRALTRAQIDEFLERAERVRLAYAFESRSTALREMNEALRFGRRAQASLMRDNRAASRFLDTCLISARHALEYKQDRDAARRLIRACLLEAVDTPITPGEHPPEIIALIDEVKRDLQEEPASKLTVRSQPEGCDVYINGRFSAKTNAELSRPLQGEYPIQVECGDAGGSGRVHVHAFGKDAPVLEVDTQFESAVRTGDHEREHTLRLEFADAEALQAHAGHYAMRVADVLGATYAVLVTSPAEGQARAILLRGPAPRVHADMALLGGGRPGRDVRDAARTLVAGSEVPAEHLCTEAVVRSRDVDGEQAARELAARCPEDPQWQRPTEPAYPADVVALFEQQPEPAPEVAPAPAPPAVAEQAAPKPASADIALDVPGGSPRGIGPYVVIGAGGLMLGAAAVTAVMVSGTEQKLLDAGCEDACPARYDDTRERGDTLKLTTNVLLGAGLATVAGGALWLWLDGDAETAASDSQGESFAAGLRCGPGYCGATAQGRF